jgi:hypothetical protein
LTGGSFFELLELLGEIIAQLIDFVVIALVEIRNAERARCCSLTICYPEAIAKQVAEFKRALIPFQFVYFNDKRA